MCLQNDGFTSYTRTGASNAIHMELYSNPAYAFATICTRHAHQRIAVCVAASRWALVLTSSCE